MIFVSQLDDITFFLSSLGVLGRGPEAMSKSIKNFQFDQQVATYKKRCLMTLFLFTLLSLGFGVYILSLINQIKNKGLDPVILVEFGDSQDPEIGIYSGCYELTADGPLQRVKYAMMEDPQYNTFESEFRYDKTEKKTWMFFKDIIDKDPYLLSSSGDHVNSFDLMDSNNDVWVIRESSTPISFVKLIGTDNQSIIERECMRESENTTDFKKEFCPILFVDTSVEDPTVEWSEEYEFLTYLNESVVFYYQRPIYKGLDKGDFIFFTGRHWALTGRDIAKKIGNNNNFTEFLHGERLTANYKSTNKTLIAYLSEANNGDTPLGLRWFRKVDRANFDFPAVDVSNPIALSLKCGQCDDLIKPCEFEGKCVDGVCNCEHGAEGALCGIMPLNNGICNEYFNHEKYEFDGGDCCASTCNNPVKCGITTSPEAFGKALAGEFNVEFPHCIDTKMAPLEIKLNPSVNREGLTEDTNFRKYEIKVVCNDKTKKERKTHLQISMDPNITEEMSEIVHVPSHYACNLIFKGIQNPRLFKKDPNAYLKINVTIQDKLLNTTDDGVNLMPTYTVEDDATIQIPEAYNRCLLKYLLNDSNVLDASLLYNETNYQDRAVAWLDNETFVTDGCQANKNWFIERYAIVALSQNAPLYNFNASNVTEYPWIKRNAPHCSWTGINCDNTSSKVEELIYVAVFNHWYLNGKDYEEFKVLEGQLADEIRLLSNLEHLDLKDNKDDKKEYFNQLGFGDKQPIPTILGELTHLTLLSLHSNKFIGPIPSELGNLKKLEVLDLSKNDLTGTIPTELGKMTALKKLSILFDQGSSTSKITGTIPLELAGLSNLIDFRMRWDEITGDFPTELQDVWTKNMEYFEVLEKDFLPMEWILKMTKLKTLIWGGRSEVPVCEGDDSTDSEEYSSTDSINNSSYCEEGDSLDWEEDFNYAYTYKKSGLYFYKNVEKIPTDLGKLTELVHLKLGSDTPYFYGEIPTQLCSLTKLEHLIMDRHDLSGSIPACFANLKQLRELSLQATYDAYPTLSGTIPTSLAELRKLTKLGLDWNIFSGGIPTEFGRLTALIDLNLSNNKLNSTIPTELGNLNKLTRLNLNDNTLLGSIPTEFGNFTILKHFHLEDNTLFGSIPTEIGRLTKLEALYFQTNFLSGNIPKEFAELKILHSLWLSSNELTGTIPTELGEMVKLTILELNKNNLSGDFPKALCGGKINCPGGGNNNITKPCSCDE